jgi:hypothetical protein
LLIPISSLDSPIADALSKWVGKIPEEVVAQMADIAPMLQVLGYDPVWQLQCIFMDSLIDSDFPERESTELREGGRICAQKDRAIALG